MATRRIIRKCRETRVKSAHKGYHNESAKTSPSGVELTRDDFKIGSYVSENFIHKTSEILASPSCERVFFASSKRYEFWNSTCSSSRNLRQLIFEVSYNDRDTKDVRWLISADCRGNLCTWYFNIKSVYFSSCLNWLLRKSMSSNSQSWLFDAFLNFITKICEDRSAIKCTIEIKRVEFWTEGERDTKWHTEAGENYVCSFIRKITKSLPNMRLCCLQHLTHTNTNANCRRCIQCCLDF